MKYRLRKPWQNSKREITNYLDFWTVNASLYQLPHNSSQNQGKTSKRKKSTLLTRRIVARILYVDNWCYETLSFLWLGKDDVKNG